MSDPDVPGVRGAETRNPWRVVVADDEPMARLRLRSLLARHSGFTIVGEAADGRQALEACESLTPDLLFLDVRMPNLDGVETAAALSRGAAEGRPVPAIVFVTAFDAHAVEAFDLDAIDYLLKPVDIDRFDRALERVSARLAARAVDAGGQSRQALEQALATLAVLRPASGFAERFAVRDSKGIYFVLARDVDRIEAEGNYAALVAGGRRHLVRESMSSIAARLDPARFTRVHRSAIVAVDRIRRLQPCGHGEYDITMTDGTRLTSSRSYSAHLQALIR